MPTLTTDHTPSPREQRLQTLVHGYLDLSERSLQAEDLEALDLRNVRANRADFRSACLRNVDFSSTFSDGLSGTNFEEADVTGMVVVGRDLKSARLSYEQLLTMNWDVVHADVVDILSRAAHEVPGLLAALHAGTVNGTAYEGECACLVGTIAKLRGVHYRDLRNVGIKENSSRPAERFFLAVRKGDTPASNVYARLAATWLEAFIADRPHLAIEAIERELEAAHTEIQKISAERAAVCAHEDQLYKVKTDLLRKLAALRTGAP